MIKNVVIVNDFDYIQGGATKIAIETANLLVEYSDLNVYFFSGVSNYKTQLRDDVIQVKTNSQEAIKNKNRIKGIIDGIYNFSAKRDLNKLLKTLDENETIIHIHGWTKVLSCSVFSSCFKTKFKTILTAHDYFSICPNGGFYNFKTHKKCNYKAMSLKCVKCNCDSRSYFIKLYRIIRMFIQNSIIKMPEKLKNIIYISNLSESLLEDNFNKDICKFKIVNPIQVKISNKNEVGLYYLFVGRVCYEKGADLFCSVLSELEFPAIVVGDGPLLNELINKYKNIKFVGWKNEEEVNQYMKYAKALIFTSDWYETMGLTVLEAQMNGTPVFVRKNTAAEEFTNYSNYLFSDSEQLKVKILQFEKNQDAADGVIDFNEFAPENYIKKILRAYNSLN